MRRPLSILFLPLVLSLAFVGSNLPRVEPVRANEPRPPVDDIEVVTGRIDTTLTLGAWLKAHPSETVVDSAPTDRPLEEMCVSAKSQVKIGGRTAARWAVFNVPRPTPGETLPEDTPDIASRECHLRAIWLVVDEPDSARAHALADALSKLVDARLGKSTPRTEMGGPGHAHWTEPRKWAGPGTTVVLGISPQENREIPADEGVVDTEMTRPQGVSILAYAPYSGLDDIGGPDFNRAFAYLDEEEQWEGKWYLDKADSAISRVTIPSIASDLRVVMSHLRSKSFPSPPSPASAALVRAASAIFDQAPRLKPPQRAALLLAGDLVLQRTASAFELGSDTTSANYHLYKSLVTAGVEYGPEAYMVGHPYARKWLWEAYRLDSLGTAGHTALLELLASGWKTSAGCEENVDEIARVIEHGEAAMRRGDIDPLIQYYVGIAYQDIYSLARGHYYEGYSNPAEYEPKAEEARVLGIERLRTSLLSGLKDRHLRRDAWRTAVRLMLHKTSQPRYFCFDD
jgi:hypothetical protein